MGDKWDYKMRKVEMAWDLTQSKIKGLLRDKDGARQGNDEDFHKKIADDLQKSWDTINRIFPSHESD